MRRDLPVDLCLSIDIAVDPRPEGRGSIRDLREALADALPAVGGARDLGRRHPVEAPTAVVGLRDPQLPEEQHWEGWREDAADWEDERDTRSGELAWDDDSRQRGGWGGRIAAAAGTAALAAAAGTWLGPTPPVRPAVAAAAAGAAALLLPRLSWLAVAGAVVAWLGLAPADGGAGAPGLALLVGVAALPVAMLLRGAPGAWWSTPALAPVLGVAGIAGAWPAVAGQAPRPWYRAALGALGAWWLLLAEPLVRRSLLLGPPRGAWPPAGWETSSTATATHVVWPLLDGGALAIAGLWAVGALVLPLIVRGRRAWLDLLVAGAWAAALAGGAQAIAERLAWAPGAASGGHPVRGLIAGACAAALVAVIAASGSGPRRPAEDAALLHARGTRSLA
jgi:hypothetical protein